MFLYFLATIIINTSIYSLQFTDLQGQTHSMNAFAGKKIVLVNIGSTSSYVGQLAALQQLHQRVGDSIIIIAFPSNSFGNEPKSNAEIAAFCQSQYNTSFLIAQKNPISGPSIQPIYQWLTSISENGVVNDPVRGDFQKFLINESGMLIGIYSPVVDPLSAQLLSALRSE